MTADHADLRRGRDQRVNLRVTGRQEQLIRQAASATDRTMTDFILDSVVERAEQVLADRRWFLATDQQWSQFEILLDSPLPSADRFARLAARSSPFDEE